MTPWKRPFAQEITETYSYSASGPVGSVTYRTGGPRGGDAGHGGYLEIAFDTARCSTSLGVDVEATGYGAVVLDEVDAVTLRYQGDGEMAAAVDCFEFLAEKLRAIFPSDEAAVDAYGRDPHLIDDDLVQTDRRGGTASNLRCPRCDSSYLHQADVIVWNRGEDHEVETQTVIAGGRTRTGFVDARSSGNPSARRQGLAIRFECEACSEQTGDRIELVIGQHKGETEIGWRYRPASSGKGRRT